MVLSQESLPRCKRDLHVNTKKEQSRSGCAGRALDRCADTPGTCQGSTEVPAKQNAK